MLRIYGRRSSANVQKVLWLAAELELVYEHIPAGGLAGGLDTPEFKAMNPHGKVPVIADHGVFVWESHSILRYLAAQYGESRFWRAEPAQRARVDAWMDWSQTIFQPDFLGGVFWGFYRTPEAQRDRPAIDAALQRSAKDLALLDAQLGDRPFVVGKQLSLADIAIGTLLYRYFTLDIPRPSLPKVSAWYERLSARPAYQAHVMLPYEELRARLDF